MCCFVYDHVAAGRMGAETIKLIHANVRGSFSLNQILEDLEQHIRCELSQTQRHIVRTAQLSQAPGLSYPILSCNVCLFSGPVQPSVAVLAADLFSYPLIWPSSHALWCLRAASGRWVGRLVWAVQKGWSGGAEGLRPTPLP